MITVEPDDRAFSAEFWSIPDHAGLPYDAVLAALHPYSAAEVVQWRLGRRLGQRLGLLVVLQ